MVHLRLQVIWRSDSMTRTCSTSGGAVSSADAGKIERWHQTQKNRILLDNYYLPVDLEQQIDSSVEHLAARMRRSIVRRF